MVVFGRVRHARGIWHAAFRFPYVSCTPTLLKNASGRELNTIVESASLVRQDQRRDSVARLTSDASTDALGAR